MGSKFEALKRQPAGIQNGLIRWNDVTHVGAIVFKIKPWKNYRFDLNARKYRRCKHIVSLY